MNLKRTAAMLVIASMMILPACGSKEDHPKDHGQTAIPQKLTIEFATNPAEVQPDKEAELIARVSKGGVPVKDATVDMEIWREGDGKHEKLRATPDQKGAYTSKKTFSQAGIYHATIHTTTSEIHQMPTFDFQVGTVQAQPAQPSDHQHDKTHAAEIHFQLPEKVKANQETTLAVRLEKDHKPLTGAGVHFEYWRSTDEKHSYAGAMEKSPGEYSVPVTFTAPGEYTVRVHLEKDDLHDHKEMVLKVEN